MIRLRPWLVNLCALLVLAGAAALATPAAASPQAPAIETEGNAARPARDADPQALRRKRQEVRERIHALRAHWLAESLALDTATTARLRVILERHDAQIAERAREQRQLRRQMRDLLDRNAGAAAIEQVIDRLVALQRAMWELEEARFHEMRQVLTPAQAAELLIVLPQIDRKLRHQVRRAMRRGPGWSHGDNPDDDHGAFEKRAPGRVRGEVPGTPERSRRWRQRPSADGDGGPWPPAQRAPAP